MLRCPGAKLVFAALLPLQAGLFVVLFVITQDWYSANFRRSLVDPLAINASPAVRSFLAEYEKYCQSQLIPLASNVPDEAAVSSTLCPCVPDTLGKCSAIYCCLLLFAMFLSVAVSS